MASDITTDICVIGAGAGGLSVAAAAAQLGTGVVLIEKGRMGGDCLNYGCVPSKSLIAAANRAHQAGTRLGVTIPPAAVDFAAIAPHDSEQRYRVLGCTVIRAAARFVAPDRVAAGGKIIRARRFVIATGSSPSIPDIPGLDRVPYLTNETIFELDTLPDHLVILGGGPIGCELGQAFRRLGGRVTIISRSFLKKDDPELAAVVLDALRRDGVVLHRSDAAAISDHTGGFEIRLYDGTLISGSHLLVAAGRRADTRDLGLEAAGIAISRQGIKVDRRLRTSNPRVYAVGDVTGREQFTHMAGYDAGVVIRNALFRFPAKVRDDMTPRCTFTGPELAQAGLTEAAARAAGLRDIKVVSWPLADNDRARAEGIGAGMIKVIAGSRGRILGAGIVGPHAGDLIQPWCLALSRGLKLSAMTGYIAPYPTLGEVSKRVAGTYYEPMVFGPMMKRLVAFLAKFG